MSWRAPGRLHVDVATANRARQDKSSKSGTIRAMPRCGHRRAFKERMMTILKWALIFFLVSVVAGILGFTDISAASADVARFLFYVFVVIFLVLLILGLTIFRV
jgi:uncharacterized membrane protein YtjA (UPF0391 family)